MFQTVYYSFHGQFQVLRDGRIAGSGQPEPEFLRRRYEQAQVLREINRETRIRELIANDSQRFVDRVRAALGIA
ncbi:MAG: hypothetical protein IPI33_00145 [Dehalococcoidia bacterium]|uniref:hypothetical protein n=1 Tax=Candidatus Amarobacter glycogenicus TaxID=3140699 RepID=UPI001D5473E6|nr:hypothetical protein [Dehalococcoidia bacterium]MBK9610978.1 hypothetical protein [Dehalococcoidia bacterium]